VKLAKLNRKIPFKVIDEQSVLAPNLRKSKGADNSDGWLVSELDLGNQVALIGHIQGQSNDFLADTLASAPGRDTIAQLCRAGVQMVNSC
jgi:hypothetical protein